MMEAARIDKSVRAAHFALDPQCCNGHEDESPYSTATA
jgi:hypothetical protein